MYCAVMYWRREATFGKGFVIFVVVSILRFELPPIPAPISILRFDILQFDLNETSDLRVERSQVNVNSLLDLGAAARRLGVKDTSLSVVLKPIPVDIHSPTFVL